MKIQMSEFDLIIFFCFPLDIESVVAIPGFGGSYCEQERNHCETSPCRNNATCLDLQNGFKCLCTSNFTGEKCDGMSYEFILFMLLAYRSRRLIGWDFSRRPSVRVSTLSSMDISETRGPILIKFYLKHH